MAVSPVSGGVFMDQAIPGITDISSLAAPVNNPLGTKTFPNLTPAQSAANANAAGATPGSSSTSSTAPGGALDKTAFLQLLVKEMTNQDPMNPADSTQFVAQLAQFSTLEQMQNVNDGIGKLQSSFQEAEARGMLGIPITAVNSTTGKNVSGTVDKILLGSSGIQVDVSGTPVDLTDITAVGAGPATGP